MDTWRAKWTSTPAPRPSGGGGGAIAGADVVGVSFQAFALQVNAVDNGTRYSLVVQDYNGVRVNDTTQLKCGQRIAITEWNAGPVALPSEVRPLDLVRVEGLYAKSGSTPGKVYLNCSGVVVVRSCWSMGRDAAFLAAQQPSLVAGGVVLLTTLSIELPPTSQRAGLMSTAAVWPIEVTRNNQEPHLVLQWNYMPVAVGERDPTVYQVAAKLWKNHCDILMGGAMPVLPVWQALMESGKHPVPLALLCCLNAKRSNLANNFLEVQVLGVRADLPSYLAEHCPRVSKELAAAHAATIQSATGVGAGGEDGVIHVSVVGMPIKSGCHYYAMTSNRQGLHDDATIRSALEEGTTDVVCFFAVAKEVGEKDKEAKEPPTKEQRKK